MEDTPAVDLNDRESIIDWLEWCDPNGVWRDWQCEAEDIPVMTLGMAQNHFAHMNREEELPEQMPWAKDPAYAAAVTRIEDDPNWQ